MDQLQLADDLTDISSEALPTREREKPRPQDIQERNTRMTFACKKVIEEVHKTFLGHPNTLVTAMSCFGQNSTGNIITCIEVGPQVKCTLIQHADGRMQFEFLMTPQEVPAI